MTDTFLTGATTAVTCPITINPEIRTVWLEKTSKVPVCIWMFLCVVSGKEEVKTKRDDPSWNSHTQSLHWAKWQRQAAALRWAWLAWQRHSSWPETRQAFSLVHSAAHWGDMIVICPLSPLCELPSTLWLKARAHISLPADAKRSRTSFHTQLLSRRAFIWPRSIF